MDLKLIIEVLKLLITLLGPLLLIAKFFRGTNGKKGRGIEAQYQKIKAFFQENDSLTNPLLLEWAFGSAVGHTKFTASEIPLILKQHNPTSFMKSYMKVRDYLSPNSDSTKLELQSIAAKPKLRKAIVASGLALYIVFAGLAFWVLLYAVPILMKAGLWAQVWAAFVVISISGLLAIFFLVEASKLHWAAKLYANQR